MEQAIGHLVNAWTLRRWRGLLYRVRDVYRAAAALICPRPMDPPHPDMKELTDTCLGGLYLVWLLARETSRR